MTGVLTKEEHTALQTWAETGSAPRQRRARIILLHDEGQGNSAIAAQVGLTERQVRRWLAAFREKRMGIFPVGAVRDPEIRDSEIRDADVEQGMAMPAAPLTIEELRARNEVDIGRANHVQSLALELFDLTADVHCLSSQRRALLGTAALLHDLGRGLDPDRPHQAGRDLILAQPLAGLDRAERDMLASIVALHHKKVRRRREAALMRLPAPLQQETLALAALLRLARALDASQTQSTTISQVQAGGGWINVVVAGPAAAQDAAAAARRLDLWQRLFDVDLSFVTEEQLAQAPLSIAFGTEPVSLPEMTSPGLLPDDPMSEAGRKTLWFHFLRMLKHEPGTRAGEDIEELHDMRVATRRMRAAIRVFGDFFEPEAIKPFNRGIRRVTRTLGPVRDLDVFEEKARRYLETLPEASRGGLDPLLEAWHAERVAAREKMLAFLDSERYRKFKQDFSEFLQTEGAGARPVSQGVPAPYQVRHVAPRLIYTRYETVRAYETVLEDAQIETLHALRIDCKYLRYTLEFLREVLGPEGAAVIEEVKAMQDHLGDLNDAEVAIGLLSEFLRDWDASQSAVPLSQRRSAEGVVTYMAARHAEKHRLLTTFPEAWARLNREEVRRWLALAVAAL
jgi:CHAD domain-containing protein